LIEHESGKYKNLAKLIKETNDINAQDENDGEKSALHIGTNRCFYIYLFIFQFYFLLLNSC
jgi:hypothetical protein